MSVLDPALAWDVRFIYLFICLYPSHRLSVFFLSFLLAGEVTRELQVVGNAASIAIRTWVRSNDKTKARAEEREKNIGWILPPGPLALGHYPFI